MAVIIVDNRSILDECDANTNFNTGAADTSIFAEASGCVAVAINETTGQMYYDAVTPNLTLEGNKLIYLWSACIATLNSYKEVTPADSSHAMYLGDGIDGIIIYMAGNDRDVFKHADNQVTFQCFMVDLDYLDTLNANGDLAAIAGSYGAFDPTSLTLDIGAHYTTLSKALGGGVNCYIDIIRYGTGGVSIVGGTTGDPGKFSEIAAGDRSTSTLAGHGICREYTPGAYGIQGTLQFGDHGDNDAIFEDSGVAVTFEDRPVADDKFKLIIEGDGTNTNKFDLSNSSIVSARPGVEVDMSSDDIDILNLSSVSFVNLLNPISFPYDSDVYSHTVVGSSFSNCGQVTIGSAEFRNCTFSESAADSTAEEAAAWLEFDYEDIENCTFSDNYYAIVMGMDSTSDEAITFTDLIFSNNTYDVLWLGTGTLTITVVGGTIPTYLTPNGGTVLLPSSVSLTMTVKDEAGDVIVGAFAYIDDDNETPFIMNTTTNGSGIATVAHTGGAVGGSTWRVRLYGFKAYKQTIDIAGDDISIPVTLIADPQQT